MKGRVAHFKTRLGTPEARLYFPEWHIGARVFRGVSVYPHLCGSCAGGDHVHVDIEQEPVTVLPTEVNLSHVEVTAIEAYLLAATRLNALTSTLDQKVRA